MKGFVCLVSIFGLLLATASSLPSQEGPVMTAPVVIAWQIQIDDPTSFDFSNLKVDIQFRFGKYHGWNELPLITPDSNGRFVTTIPAGQWVSVEVGTDDPTVSWETGKPKRPDSYEMREDIRQTVFRDEIYVKPGPARAIQRVLQLHRGAAFTICIPPSMNSGSIQYYLRSKAAKGRNVISFTDPHVVMGNKVGGLMPGRWIVKYYDDRDAVILSQELDLHRGEVLNPACRSGLIEER
jgi:hypothetical protein